MVKMKMTPTEEQMSFVDEELRAFRNEIATFVYLMIVFAGLVLSVSLMNPDNALILLCGHVLLALLTGVFFSYKWKTSSATVMIAYGLLSSVIAGGAAWGLISSV